MSSIEKSNSTFIESSPAAPGSRRVLPGRLSIAIAIAVAVGAVIATANSASLLAEDAQQRPEQQIAQAMQEIRKRYAGEVDEQQLADAAITAMLAALDDPNCEYLSGSAAQRLEKQIQGDGAGTFHSSQHVLGGRRCLYLRLSAFHRGVAQRMRRQLAAYRSAEALCLDLRNNPGGLLDEAVQVCDLLLSRGVIVTSITRDAPNKDWAAQPAESDKLRPWEDRPVIVLVNRFTASAAEIVAAALQDHHRATIVGERTWGKASVQRVVRMKHGAVLKLTAGHYQRPSGRSLDRAANNQAWGVQPDDNARLRLSERELAKWTRSQQAGGPIPSDPQLELAWKLLEARWATNP